MEKEIVAKNAPSENEKIVLEIINKGIKSCHPDVVLRSKIKVSKKCIMVDNNRIDLGSGKLYVLGCGKAAAAMADSVESILGDKIDEGVVVSIPGDYETKKIKILGGSFPLPTFETVQSSKKIIELAERCKENDNVLFLVTGGGSALFSFPVPEIKLEDLRNAIELLFLNKVEDGERNIVWKHMSLVKGGKLAKLIYPGSIYNLILSDYIGNVLDVIGSGPTVPDAYTFQDALDVIEKNNLTSKFPTSVLKYFKENLNKSENETIKSDSNVFKKTKDIIVLDNRKGLENFKEVAMEYDFKVFIHESAFKGSTEDGVEELNSVIKKHMDQNSNFVVLAGGEIPVKVKKGGKGGRAQHFAALMIPYLKNYKNSVFAAFSTDGRDYIEGISGALINNNTMEEIEKRELDLGGFVNSTNTYVLHEKLGSHLITKSPTHTHVSDIYIFAHWRR